MRQALYEVLQPDFSKPESRETHKALLDLATLHNDNHSIHLVTTNFDSIFEDVIHRNKQRRIHTYCAPYLPNPRLSSWNGLVYLHGLLPEQKDDDDALKRLVVTSGDFGLAYLKDRCLPICHRNAGIYIFYRLQLGRSCYEISNGCVLQKSY